MKPSRFFLFTTLFFATAAQAATGEEPRMNMETFSPATAPNHPMPEFRLPDLGGDKVWGSRFSTTPRGGARYGTGYETRQSLGARGAHDRDR